MINKQNRKSQEGHNVHIGWSISAREHAKRMISNYIYFFFFQRFDQFNIIIVSFFQRLEMNRESTCYELYERLHRPKGKPDELFNEKQAKIVVSIRLNFFNAMYIF